MPTVGSAGTKYRKKQCFKTLPVGLGPLFSQFLKDRSFLNSVPKWRTATDCETTLKRGFLTPFKMATLSTSLLDGPTW